MSVFGLFYEHVKSVSELYRKKKAQSIHLVIYYIDMKKEMVDLGMLTQESNIVS